MGEWLKKIYKYEELFGMVCATPLCMYIFLLINTPKVCIWYTFSLTFDEWSLEMIDTTKSQ